MAVKIRLQRHGRRKRPFYHIVVADARSPRDGKFIEKIGTYNPMTSPATIDLDTDSAFEWLKKGAQPTDTAKAILKFKGVLYRKHLMRGVEKGALSQEAADKLYQDWIDAKEATIAERIQETRKKQKDHWEMVSGKIPKVEVKAAPATLDEALSEVTETPASAEEASETTTEEVVEATTEKVEETVEVVEPVAEVAEPVEEVVEEVVVEPVAEEVVAETPTEVVEEVVEKVEEAPVEALVAETPEEVKKPKALPKKYSNPNDLTLIEGIGPKSNDILQEAGIADWKTLANTSVEKLQEILNGAGKSFSLLNPSTWAEQAALAADGKFEELEKLQDELDGGIRK